MTSDIASRCQKATRSNLVFLARLKWGEDIRPRYGRTLDESIRFDPDGRLRLHFLDRRGEPGSYAL